MLNEIKTLSGSVLGIGLEDKLKEAIDKNKKILEIYMLDSKESQESGIVGHRKIVQLNKIKRIFKLKSFDYIIVNFEEVKPYLRKFIKNSIYLNRNTIYFYNINDFDIDELNYRYKRYGCNCSFKKNRLEIEVKDIKTKWYKNICYQFRDLGYDIIEYISKILIN